MTPQSVVIAIAFLSVPTPGICKSIKSLIENSTGLLSLTKDFHTLCLEVEFHEDYRLL